jgi:hypothetical protein
MENLDIYLLTFVVVSLFVVLISKTFQIFSATVDKANNKDTGPNAKPIPRTPWLGDK